MNFPEKLFNLMKRIASIDIAQGSARINEDGIFELGVIAVCEGEVAPIGAITENSATEEFDKLSRQLDSLEIAAREEDEADDRRRAAIREVLTKLTREERILIDRPLPEEMLPDDDGEVDYQF